MQKMTFEMYFFFLVFKENKPWHFVWIICLADYSHKMSRLVFSEKKKKKIECHRLKILLHALWVKYEVTVLYPTFSLTNTFQPLNPAHNLQGTHFFVPRLFEEKWRDTVFGFPWGVVRGAWCMARGAWRVVRGSEFLVGTLSP